ncbi:hypothetical protein N7463_007858 [Penicillium fimorum]|uniref:Uncharacterized protein n=1 Tax=Penicillium fimorum TaxID=1882269 RepID=A0A9W9XX23_9EURO|nr:hypothetical protein N7463_007858 [Penicillium fimorum]
MSCPTNCTPLKQALNDSVIPLHGKIPCLGKTLKGQNCKAPISRDRQTKALCILECCIYCARPGGLPLKYAINDLAKLLVHQQHNGEQDAAYARWRNMVKEFKGKGENPMREHPSETIDEPVDPELIATRRHAHTIERNGSNQTSSLSYEEPTEIQQDQTVEGGQPDRDMILRLRKEFEKWFSGPLQA